MEGAFVVFLIYAFIIATYGAFEYNKGYNDGLSSSQAQPCMVDLIYDDSSGKDEPTSNGITTT
jgi:hypothetical protein